MNSIITNTWISTTSAKPWRGRDVLCRLPDGNMLVLRWNGLYWTDRFNIRQLFPPDGNPTHFYIFEKFNQKTIDDYE